MNLQIKDSIMEIPIPVSENLDNFRSIIDSYYVHICIGVIFLTCFVLFYVFEERVKSFLRIRVRKILFRLQTGGGKGNEVNTTSKTSENKLVQMLTYLEQTWLRDGKSNVRLPSNVHLDDSYRIMSTDEQQVSDNGSEPEEGFQARDV